MCKLELGYNVDSRAPKPAIYFGGISIMKTTKKCNKCYQEKSLLSFGKNTRLTLGIKSSCKKCEAIQCTIHSRTIKGLISKIYGHQRSSSKNRKMQLPTYSKSEFTEWITSRPNFIELFDTWVNSGYDKYLRPSVDRIDDYVGYTLGNIQLMTWGENDTKGSIDVRNGVNTKRSKAVLQFSLGGDFIQEHHSLSQAGRSCNIDFKKIHYAIKYKNGKPQSCGFLWKYKGVQNGKDS